MWEEAVIPLHELLDDQTNGCDCRYWERSLASAVLIRELYWLLDHVNEMSSEQWNRRRDAVMTYRSPHA
jgi:hypothetical protein